MAVFQTNDLRKSKNSRKRIFNNYYMSDTIRSQNSMQSLSINTYTREFGSLSLLNRTNIPASHKRIADSYVFVRRVFGTPVVHNNLTEAEVKLLSRFDFYPLEYTTSSQMEQELEFLRKWSSERDEDLRAAADSVILLRSKELKHLIATNYISVKRNLHDGYKVLDRYFQEISKYNRK